MNEDKMHESKNNSSDNSDNSLNSHINSKSSTENDFTFEEDSEGIDGSIKGDVKLTISKLRHRLKEAEAQKVEYLTGWQRAKADFINARKKDEEEKRLFAKFARSDLVLELIPVLDSFDMAIANKESWEKSPVEWRKGIEQIHSQLLSILSTNGLKELNPNGEPFDPSKEEAVGFVDTENAENEGKILQVLQKGYTLHDKLLRPAKVKIGRHVNS